MTIVYYDYRPKRARKAKPAVQFFRAAGIVGARKPKPRHYGLIRYGVPDEAQRTELNKQFMARALKPQGGSPTFTGHTGLPRRRGQYGG